ncbi:MAG TPA: TetR/AcrR family transcriptional regulator [Trebonia sp.]
MSRWAPDARERLETAALALFGEHGYEETTVAQIADRAGLNRATFFRHFADKREVLFGGEDVLAGLFADGIRAASPEATLTGCLQAAFAAAGAAMTSQQRVKAAQRVLVVAANSELQERGLLKHARIARSISAALQARGTDELTARLGAEVGMLAFRVAVERWMKADNDEPFPLQAAAALHDLQACAAELRPGALPAGRASQGPGDDLGYQAGGTGCSRSPLASSARAAERSCSSTASVMPPSPAAHTLALTAASASTSPAVTARPYSACSSLSPVSGSSGYG